MNRFAVSNYRSIEATGWLPLSGVTVLIGPNNAGKSSLLRALHLVQNGSEFNPSEIRVGALAAEVVIEMADPTPNAVLAALRAIDPDSEGERKNVVLRGGFKQDGKRAVGVTWATDGNEQAATGVEVMSFTRPNHLIVPIMFGRTPLGEYTINVTRQLANNVVARDDVMTARLAVLGGDTQSGARYREYVQRVLGVTIGTFVVDNGQAPGVPLDEDAGILLSNMGAGVRGAIRLLTELASGGSHLYLLEEPENDLHPAALRALLEIIKENVDRNQFIVSTHNDLVLRELGSLSDSLVYETSAIGSEGIPTSKYTALTNSFERQAALRTLGYDMGLPYGWLVLEEASAERFITGALIPLFHPYLAALRTVSAAGAGNAPRMVAALKSMVVFAHLSDQSKPRAWVLLDGDESGLAALERLRSSFSSWPADRFDSTGYRHIEDAYPARFREQSDAALSNGDPSERMRLKGELANDVVSWSRNEPDVARRELSQSAAHLLARLATIESQADAQSQ